MLRCSGPGLPTSCFVMMLHASDQEDSLGQVGVYMWPRRCGLGWNIKVFPLRAAYHLRQGHTVE
jgi:hypothetical protein